MELFELGSSLRKMYHHISMSSMSLATVSLATSSLGTMSLGIIRMIRPPLCSSDPLQMDGSPDDQNQRGAEIVANDHPEDPVLWMTNIFW